ncbi:MAG: ammonium transporter [Pseudomonadota bacterium]
MNSGDNAWVLVSSALVLLMTPGLAMFYGGMTRSKNVLSTMMHSFVLMCVASVIWVLWGFSLAFAPDAMWGLIGGGKYLGLKGIDGSLWPASSIPVATFVMFQCGFAVLTPALISGAFAERMDFGAFLIFTAAWATLVYAPICHWVWGPGGLLLQMGALDFAGGTVVHINAGMAGLACALVIGPRRDYPKRAMLPHNLPLTLLGAGILWIGWFGFNAGSALKANESAGMAFLTTHVATASAGVSWVLLEWFATSKPTSLGLASGALAGLVAITPAAGFVGPAAALLIGGVAGFLCYLGVLAKYRFGYDDSFDVFGIHGIGGAWGALATGLFASRAFGGTDGFLYGNTDQLVVQLIAISVTAVYSFAATYLILRILNAVVYLRVSEEEEEMGVDMAIHGESGYNGL